MVGNNKLGAAELIPASAQRAHAVIHCQQILRRRGAEGHNDLRLHDIDLLHQERRARVHFVFFWSAIVWWAALHHVGDIDILAANSHGGDHVVEQLSRTTHKRLALRIFIGSRAFTDEHDVRIRITYAENQLGTALAQTATRAIAYVLTKSNECGWLVLRVNRRKDRQRSGWCGRGLRS